MLTKTSFKRAALAVTFATLPIGAMAATPPPTPAATSPHRAGAAAREHRAEKRHDADAHRRGSKAEEKGYDDD